MSGKRQHFIPRFLQKCFASHFSRNGEVFTWIYRKGQKPLNTNIKNVGVEGFFYSIENDSSLDDKITEAEESISGFVESLRNGQNTDYVDQNMAASTIAHFETRTRHLRMNMYIGIYKLLQRMVDCLSSPDHCANFIINLSKDEPGRFEQAFRDDLYKYKLPRQILPELMRNRDQLLKMHMGGIVNTMQLHMRKLEEMIPSGLAKAVKGSHIKALDENIVPEAKKERYDGMVFSLEKCLDTPLILGDSIVVFHIGGERKFKPFLEHSDKLQSVLLPISPTQLLVGSIPEYRFHENNISRTIAECSLEFFIANSANFKEDNLSKLIGRNSDILTDHRIDEITREFELKCKR